MKSKLTLLIAICLWAACAGQSGAVEAAETATSIKADTIEYNTKTGMTVATGNVRIEQDGNVITAPQAEYNTKSKSGQATGGVIMTRSDGNSTSDRLILHDEDHLTVLGNAVVVQADKTLRAPQIEYYKTRGYAETVGGWSELTMTDGSSLTATRLTYDEGTEMITANGNVRIKSIPNNLVGSSDQATYNTGAGGVIELIGNATATQNGNTISGAKLRITGDGNTAQADGNVVLVYVPETKSAEPA